LPALCEETFFRAGLLGGMINSRMNKHIAVWLSAFIFSFIHFQFLGFMPRFILGAFLGYCFIYTKSIWTSITFHFINNFAAVMIMYYFPELA
jgi:membrane protease YdiL (CAAX protease family)